MDKIKRIKKLNKLLRQASYAYYGLDKPIISDKKYDDLLDELSKLESETGCILAGSPTQNVQGYVLDGFKKVKHTKPMLSAKKTKDVEEIKKFIGDNDHYSSYKLDGLTLVVRYNKDGKFVQGITRGNGIEGEDVTEQCRFIKNLPMQISCKHELELRGECVLSWEEFYRINRTLEIPYTHPRNLAAGTLRNLDLNIVKERNLSFIVFEMVSPTFTHKTDGLIALEEMGFECVERCTGDIEACVDGLLPEYYPYPTDGLIFEFNNSEYSKSLGKTSKHENCRMALKWEDELYETRLLDIEWNTSKTGLINPVAIFEAVDLDGAMTTRATLHNVSYIEKLQLGIGDIIRVYRANMVIPKVHDNLTKKNTWELPDKCLTCGGRVELHNDNGSKTLHCTNPDCQAKLLGKLAHFVSKNATNIDGLSEATIEKFIELGWLTNFMDIYRLSKHKEEMITLDGFGKRSVEKLLDAIEKSREVSLDKFLYAQSIPLIGKSASKDIAKHCQNDINAFCGLMDEEYDFTIIDGFGTEMQNSLNMWWTDNRNEFVDSLEEFKFESTYEVISDKKLDGLNFVITGSLMNFGNRTELQNLIESLGGKVSGSVSSKTSYLINNDVNSTSGKNKKAKELGVSIITEDDFAEMIK